MTRHLGAAFLLAVLIPPAGADPSLECSVNASSQVEISACLAGVEAAANEALQIILGEAQRSAAELDEITARQVAVPALEAGQSAWENYRDAHCGYAGALFGGGSGTGIAIRSCRIELTRARAASLQASLP